jgi:hypothetical protein
MPRASSGFTSTSERRVVRASGTRPGLPGPEKANGAVDNLWWEFHDGTQTTAPTHADEQVRSGRRPAVDELDDRPRHCLRHADGAARPQDLDDDPEFHDRGAGRPLYDPRKDTTAGGSGSQRADDDSTWAFSDNPAVIIYNILLGIYGTPASGCGGCRTPTAASTPSRLPVCQLGRGDGRLRPGHRSQGRRHAEAVPGWTQHQRRRDASRRDQRVPRRLHRADERGGGAIYDRGGDPGSASFSFTDADIVTRRAELEPFPGMDEIINGAIATYLEPSQAWESKETAPYLNSTFEDADDGRRQLAGLTLNTVFDGKQAQRVAKATVKDGRRFARHVVTLPPQFSIYRPLLVGDVDVGPERLYRQGIPRHRRCRGRECHRRRRAAGDRPVRSRLGPDH